MAGPFSTPRMLIGPRPVPAEEGAPPIGSLPIRPGSAISDNSGRPTPPPPGVALALRGRWRRPFTRILSGTPEMLLPGNPNRLGVYLTNQGGFVEVPIALPNLSTAVLDSAGVVAPAAAAYSTYKSLYLQVDTALAWVTAGQPTVKLIVGRSPWPAAGGAASQVGAGNTFPQAVTKGASANLGPAAATSLAVALWPFSPADLGDLQWEHPYVGLEITFPSALTAGAARLFLEMPGNQIALIGQGKELGSAYSEAQLAYGLGYGNPFFVQHDGEIWGQAAGGTVAVTVWELLRLDSSFARP